MHEGLGGTPAVSSLERPSLSEVTVAVCSLAELMSSHGLSTVDLTVGDVIIHLSAASRTGGTFAEAAPQDSGQAIAEPAPAEAAGEVITAPMIGTYYASPAPGETAFVRIGDHIESGQVIGIIEAMKIMNEIAADRTGVVSEILVQNAQAVEYGSPLMRVVPE